MIVVVVVATPGTEVELGGGTAFGSRSAGSTAGLPYVALLTGDSASELAQQLPNKTLKIHGAHGRFCTAGEAIWHAA